MNHLVYIVLDSCRYDSFMAAKTPNFDRLGKADRRYSYASWTSPSHTTILMGMMPHASPKNTFASTVYKKEYVQWGERLGIENVEFKTFVPRLSLANFLKRRGYATHARVSLPVLNEKTMFNQYFDTYKLQKPHNDFAGMMTEMNFQGEQPVFFFCNTGETHYPYALPGDEPFELPIIHGINGVLKNLDEFVQDPSTFQQHAEDEDAKALEMIRGDVMDKLRHKQVLAVEYMDKKFGELLDTTPKNTHFIICADHGELFGEEGYFGHGPIYHEKVFEVPLLEGIRP